MCFRAIRAKTQIVGKLLIIFHGRGRGEGGYPSMENSMEIIFFLLKPSLNDIEKILEEKEHLDERKNLFENKLKHLKKKLNPFKIPCCKSRSETKR